jgi:ribosomal protein S6--L-glutamate ligase
MKFRIIDSNRELFACYEDLQAGDIVSGRVRLGQGQEHLLLDLVSRGIHLIPSASSQLCSRSKVYQAALLRHFMVEHTLPIYSMQDMLEAVTEYGRTGVGSVVCKLDRANGGLGILRFASIEDVYSQAALSVLVFPFVIQPFVDDCNDVRVVILADTVEAYRRYNPDNFRHNLHCGGTSMPWDLTDEQLDFCYRVMARAGFLYAHVDLLVQADGTYSLSEINLRGGLRGAQMSQQDYLEKVAEIHRSEVEKLKDSGGRQQKSRNKKGQGC